MQYPLDKLIYACNKMIYQLLADEKCHTRKRDKKEQILRLIFITRLYKKGRKVNKTLIVRQFFVEYIFFSETNLVSSKTGAIIITKYNYVKYDV